jgi:hypothetical protein
MNTSNENILKSLAVLEQNLKDINSAKEQVNNVVKSSGNLVKVIESYQTSFENLSINVKTVLEDSRKFNLDSIAKLSEQTKNFSKEIAKLTELDVSKSLKSIESETIKQFQQNLSKPLESLDKHTKNIEKEITKLTEFDFKDSFIKIEKEVVYQFNLDLKEKLVSFDNKSIGLQTKIDELKRQIERLEKVDLEKLFDKLQKTLSDIFGAINAINLTLTGLITSLNSVNQSLGQIQKTVEDNFKETNIIITTFSTEINNHLNQQDKKNDIEFETLKNKIVNLSEQNIALKKEITTNRLIQIVSFVITISVLVYLIIKIKH